MGKKKEQIKIVPMSLRQVTTINKIISLYEFKFIKKAFQTIKVVTLTFVLRTMKSSIQRI